METNAPIGVFDSGVGGISVLKELVKLMPEEDFLYLGDSLHAPYGTKSLEEVRKLTIIHIKELLEHGVKGIVIACNTATSAAVAVLREMYPELPIVGIEPAIKPAVLDKPDSRILVMATPMTLKQEKFHLLLEKYEDQAKIIPLPCPGLMEFIEKGDLGSTELKNYLEALLAPLLKEPVDSIVLGCTHYPFAQKLISEVAGKDVKIFYGGYGTAKEMKRRLENASLLTSKKQPGTVQFHNSLDTKEEQALCEFLLHADI